MNKYDKMIVFILLKVCRILAKCSKDSVDTYILEGRINELVKEVNKLIKENNNG